MAMLTQLLFGLLIFFLPSNLAYHLPVSTAIVQGTLVDYLIPKFYITDIFIIAILLFWFSSFARPPLAKLKLVTCHLLLVAFFLITLIRSLLTPHPVSAFWFWLKLVEMSLFISWIRSHLKSDIYHLLSKALPLAVLWQSTLAIAQFFRQSNLIGYWFLGEPLFNATTPGIAKSGLAGSLQVLPYGTTPHPNVLAGFLAMSIYLSRSILSRSLGLVTLLLTQSLSAMAALLIPLVSKSKLLIIPLVILLLTASRYTLDADSLSRRHQLNLAAVKMWLDHPLFGVGLNQFTVYLPQYTEFSASTRFLQPVHNIYLLLLPETGLIGISIILIIFINFLKIGNWKLKIPIIMLMIIGLVDHYPLTLQTGQLLLAISLGLTLSSPKSPNSGRLPEL